MVSIYTEIRQSEEPHTSIYFSGPGLSVGLEFLSYASESTGQWIHRLEIQHIRLQVTQFSEPQGIIGETLRVRYDDGDMPIMTGPVSA